jgi:hypothetical protein
MFPISRQQLRADGAGGVAANFTDLGAVTLGIGAAPTSAEAAF